MYRKLNTFSYLFPRRFWTWTRHWSSSLRPLRMGVVPKCLVVLMRVRSHHVSSGMYLILVRLMRFISPVEGVIKGKVSISICFESKRVLAGKLVPVMSFLVPIRVVCLVLEWTRWLIPINMTWLVHIRIHSLVPLRTTWLVSMRTTRLCILGHIHTVGCCVDRINLCVWGWIRVCLSVLLWILQLQDFHFIKI